MGRHARHITDAIEGRRKAGREIAKWQQVQQLLGQRDEETPREDEREADDE